MRIFLHDYGAYSFSLQLAQSWALGGHEIMYVYGDTTQLVKRARTGGKLTGLTCKGITLSKPFHKYSFIQRYQAEVEHGQLVAREIRNFHPEMVISANTPLDSQLIIYRASQATRAKFVYWLQDVISVAIKRTMRQKIPIAGDLIGVYYELMESHLLRSSDQVVSISEDFQPLLDKWKVAPGKRHIIPNWMPLDEITPQPKQNPWSESHNLVDKFCFLFTGILGIKHDPEVFIQLASHFRINEKVRVIIISYGEKADELQKKASALNLPNLIVLPFQAVEVYSQVLGSADVLVSILNDDAGSYSVPSKVLSYFCAGKPILLSIPEDNKASKAVSLSQSGLVSTPGDLELFLENANRLYSDDELRIQMGQNSRKYAEREFDIDNILKEFNFVPIFNQPEQPKM